MEDLKVIVAQTQALTSEHSVAFARIEGRLEKFEYTFKRIEDALKSLADKDERLSNEIGKLTGRLGDISERLAHIDGRLANIPTTRQLLAILASLLIGIVGIIFAASRFLHP